jgi:hypothetical protein
MFKRITTLEHRNLFILETVIGYDQDTYLDNTETMIYIWIQSGINDYHGRTPYKYYKGIKQIYKGYKGKPQKINKGNEIVAILIAVKKW